MALTTGMVIFDGVEELDFVGPWEVFTVARKDGDRVVTISERGAAITAAKGLRVVPDHSFADAPALDVLVVPGGEGARSSVTYAPLLDWIKSTAAGCTWVTSVCTGSFLLEAAGLITGRAVTTHWAWIEHVRERWNANVLEGVRHVRDGNVVTAAGVSAGIDMSLWLVGQIYDVEHARAVQRMMEYDPLPPYAEHG
jgi:transcriptional regulator GlxA family with amidase domain